MAYRFRRVATFAIALALATAATAAQAVTEIAWWHSMTGKLNDKVNEIADKFNASQKDYKVVPVYKGQYDESMTAAIAAYRAGNAPHVLQVLRYVRDSQPRALGQALDGPLTLRHELE